MKVCSYISGQCSARTQREKEDQPEKDTSFMGEEAIQLQDLWVSLFNQRCHIRLAEKGLLCESVELDLCKSPPLLKPHPQEDPGPSRRMPRLRCGMQLG